MTTFKIWLQTVTEEKLTESTYLGVLIYMGWSKSDDFARILI